jgi:hypothetical protein
MIVRRRPHWTWLLVFGWAPALILLALARLTFHCLPLAC